MKKKKFISISFILLTFLSLAGSFSQQDFAETNAGPIETQTQLIEDADNTLHEFRETAKLSVEGGPRNTASAFICCLMLFTSIDRQESDHILSRQPVLKPSHKLFIDFGALII